MWLQGDWGVLLLVTSKSYAAFSVYGLGYTFEFHYSSESSSVCKSITSTNSKCASNQSNYTEVFPREWQVCRMGMTLVLTILRSKRCHGYRRELIKLRYCNLLNIIKTGWKSSFLERHQTFEFVLKDLLLIQTQWVWKVIFILTSNCKSQNILR